MVDPFSIVAGTAGLLDVCWRVGRYLAKVEAATFQIEQDLSSLAREVNSLAAVSQSIQAFWDAQGKEEQDPTSLEAQQLQDLWQDAGTSLEGCRLAMDRLSVIVGEIIGTEGPTVTKKRDGVRKVLRKQSRDDEINDIRSQLHTYQGSLQITLTALSFTYARKLHNSANLAIEQVSDQVANGFAFLAFKLHHELAAIRSKTKADDELSTANLRISAAESIASDVSLNKYFHIQYAVSSIFTGRKNQLRELKQVLFDSSSSSKTVTQRRFVVYGLGGSGRTEFCCKFAQDNRQSFWGVFRINVNSRESIRHGFSDIAKIAEIEANEAAGKNWLANLVHPWLLIMDNADDPRIPLEDVFPEGERGIILITTRNPTNRLHGTVGPRYYQFEKLDIEEANDLLLRAADESTPWSVTTRDLASEITKRLGYLALAIIQAGKAVARRICTLTNYLDRYDKSWQRIRRVSDRSSKSGTDVALISMNVYSTYEIIFRGLEATDADATRDAVDLLKMFSFFSFENIQIDMLTAAVEHPKRQAAKDEAQETQAIHEGSNRHTWSQMLQGYCERLLLAIIPDPGSPVLPKVLRDDYGNPFEETRLMDALDQLNQLSLIQYQEATSSYSIHPLIHMWVRERPQMSTLEQAEWCHMASSTLTQSILLPPLDTIKTAENLRRHLLPHVRHVQKCQEVIRSRMEEEQAAEAYISISRISRLFGRGQAAHPLPSCRSEAVAMAKFSLIYLHNGEFDGAEALQVRVKDYACSALSLKHQRARQATLFLAQTYLHQVRMNKAAELQAEVLRACESTLGPSHYETLKVIDNLGATRCFQGRFKESRILGEKAVQGLTELLGPDHEDTLLAMDKLGRIVWRYCEYEKARELHRKAAEGMTKLHGATHERTLISKECLATCYLSLDGNLLEVDNPEPFEIMEAVLEERRTLLGKEHPYTLYAICNLARLKSAAGLPLEAEQLMLPALPVARRNLGPNHYGTLMGQSYFASVLVKQKRFEDAEAIYKDVIQRHRYESAARDDGEHPDRIITLWALLRCYQAHGKIREALGIWDELMEAVSTIGGEGLGLKHPLVRKFTERKEELLSLLESTELAHPTRAQTVV